MAMAQMNKDADVQIAQSEKDYEEAQELLRGFQASGDIDSLSRAAQLMVGILGKEEKGQCICDLVMHIGHWPSYCFWYVDVLGSLD